MEADGTMAKVIIKKSSVIKTVTSIKKASAPADPASEAPAEAPVTAPEAAPEVK